MNEIKIFENADLSVQVRTITDENGEPWFVGKDIAEALGYAIPTKAVNDLVDKEDCKVLTFRAFSKTEKASLWDGNDFSDKTVINESGMYSLIFCSKLESAKKFKRWVTSEVLPSIRKTGGYGQAEAARIAQATEYATIEQMKQILNIRPGSAKSLRIQRWLNEKYNLGQNLPTEEQFKAQKRAARIKRLEQRLAYLKGMGKTPRINRDF